MVTGINTGHIQSNKPGEIIMSTIAPSTVSDVLNYIGGKWTKSASQEIIDVVNPATKEILGRVPMSGADDVEQAVKAAEATMYEWRCVPPGDRVQYLFGMKQLLEDNIDDIARTLVQENGKTLAEAKGEIRRVIENVEVACGIPMLMQGYNLEYLSHGIDEIMIRQP